uniref:Orange domain-containing protein n=1 Tax=Maylandia zebra TaxID=106582 RepID=A0A3P9ATH6_9CICH
MAPTITAAMSNSQKHSTLNHKKLRRERINSSIEQLKSFLGPEFLKQQTVCFLRRLQQQHQAVASAAVDKGYSRCVQEVAYVLSKEEANTLSQRRLLNHINKLQNSSDNLREAHISRLSYTVQTTMTKDKTRVNSSLWRPW